MTTTESSATRLAYPPARAAEAEQRRAWRFVAAVVVLMLVLTSAPYLFAGATAPADKHFMGLMLDVPDHIQYFSWMRDLSSANLAADRLTPEPNAPAYFNLLWWGLGHLGSATGLDYAALYTLLRVLAVFVCLGCTYAFLRSVVPDQTQQRIAFLLIAFGGGLGIIWIVVKYLLRQPDAAYPFDVYTAEPNTFLTLLGYPHFALALGLLVATFGLILVALRRQQLRYAVAAGGVALVLGLQHAYDLVTLYAVLGLFGVLMWIRDRRFPRFLFVCGLILAGLSAPPAAYALLLVKGNPVWGEVLSQFDLAGAFTPNPLHLPILLGVPFLLALFAFRPRLLQDRSDAQMFIGAWFVAHFVLAYLPIDFQIHLLLGWQIPTAILAASVLATKVGPAVGHRLRLRPNVIVAGLVALSLVTNVYLLAWRFIELRRYATPYYLSTDEVGALNWLAEHATNDDVVLAALDFGQYVPTWSDARAFLAHWTGTLDYLNKLKLVDTVLSETTTGAERQAILDTYHVTHLVIGPRDDPALAQTLANAAGFTPVFSQGAVTIYQTQ